ncbi:hypothetical protein A2U01_0067504, partial [Trifolium medium]|nr:hypothetical protein [Trifolium medium]
MARCAVHSIATEFLSASCAVRRVVWRVAPSKSCSSKGLLEVARRAGQLARRAVESGNTKMFFWKLRVVQADLARRAVEKFKKDARNGYLRVA